MQNFVDEVRMEVSSGHGGAGAVSFRREKYVPKGGPDGGDGGRGGDVIFQVSRSLRTFSHLNMKHAYRAKNGQPGMGARRHGGDGEPVVIEVPPGTVVRDHQTGQILKDFSSWDEQRWVFLQGGAGGKGNYHFRTSRRQAPRFSQPGLEGQEREILLELNLIADLGFVGLPNAGKSSLLQALTNARPEVGAYPFTTKTPHLGMMKIAGRDIVAADIPGIIEGASRGAGLGFRFLKHISRTASLVFLVDLSDEDPVRSYRILEREIREYGRGLEKKKRIILGTKADLDEDGLMAGHLREELEEPVYSVSSYARQGLEEVRKLFLGIVDEHLRSPEES